jgi:lipoate-protein ligase A
MMPKEQFSRETHVRMVMEAIHPMRPLLRLSPRFDIFHGTAKVSGSAYRLTRERAYHHGTMLLDSDLDVLTKCLDSPVKEEMRASGAAISSVISSVSNIGQLAGHTDIDHESFCNLVTKKFQQHHPESSVLDICEDQMKGIDNVRELAEDLQREEWTFDKTAPFKLKLPQADISVEDGTIIESTCAHLMGEKLRPSLFSNLLKIPTLHKLQL